MRGEHLESIYMVRIWREGKQERRSQCKAFFEHLVLVVGGGAGIGVWCGDACFPSYAA